MANAGQSAVATTSNEGELDVLDLVARTSLTPCAGKSSGIAELKNGKVHFKQKCISFEKQSETLQEIVQFREMLTQRIEKQETPLDTIPEEHRPVIAKLAHESDKTLAALSKQIRLELLPTDEDEEGPRNESSPASIALPLNVVEAAIKTITQRNNYGLDGLKGGKPPAALCVWRWEVKSQYLDWLPKAGREKAEARQKEREQAKQELSKIFYALPQDEQDKLLDPKGMLKASNKDTASNDSKATAVNASKENQPSPAKSQSGKKDGDEDSETPKKGKVRAPKTIDPEKVAKEQEKAEKKAARVEKEKKEQDAKKKSQSLMANFFTKPKKPPAAQPSSSTTNEAGPSSVSNEFTKYFKPFVTKKDMTVAPVNYFSTRRREKQPSTDEDVILIDDEDNMATSSVNDTTTPEELSSLSTTGHLRSVINHLPPPLEPTPRFTSYKPSGGFKTYSPLVVRDVFSKLSEAEVTGDTNLVRSLHYQLADRTKFAAKVLIFREDARPGYFGTWTRNSRIIGPRSPLAKDVLVFDYAYDSGEEWEEEPAGDADDVMEDGEDEDGDGDEPDSDLDSWLVDDDEDVDGPITFDDRELSPLLLPDLPPRTGKRKTDEADKKAGKKRKVVIPLVPFSKGPCWESSIGQCDDFMDQFRIQLFNDAPFPLDPFTYVAPIEKATQSNGTVPPDSGFAVPNLPVRLLNGSAGPSATNSAESSPAPNGPKKSAPVAKTAFPEALLPHLLKKINALQSKTITFLVDSIHQDLKDQNVKKNAIEAKVREVSEKSKDTKLWVVKPGIQVPS